MPYLDLEKVVVMQASEPGGDELYFTVNGTKVGPTPSLDTGDEYYFSIDPIFFSGAANVTAYEHDFGANNDDPIVSLYVASNPLDAVSWIAGAGFHYELYYNVIV